TRSGLSGILADEMGLGKTLQTLAMLQALEAESEEAAPVLIVCPTSLLGNWCQEAARFTPDLKTVRHHGPRRARKAEALLKHQLIVTSYGLLVRDLDLFKELSLRAVVLDEASAIKNPKTKTALAVCELEAPFRVALTGTPIENSARDIWSIMRFVSPGYLGEHADFQERYEGPLSAEGGAPVEVRRRFRKRLEPFILRRTKREVASELPEKIEKTLFCPLSDQQKKVYTDVLRQGREKADDLRRGNPGAAHMTMLTTLLRLRQVCCDLRLLNLPEKALEGTPGDLSSKMVALTELLDSMRDSGHRALIFSQFVGVLKLIQEAVAGLGLEHCYLDGQTRNRAEEVKRFQTSDIPVFLISLKAGGYGLNLTAADTVIHFDPWWNPAVEAQATDRAHRIGQENVVTAYKFIAQDTVEEKILRLQRKKRDVIDAALDDEQPLMQGLTTADLEEVLK
ncbi:MAG: DEAD/DEAH box helicase, partial [Verrucomicrobiota bacterium]